MSHGRRAEFGDAPSGAGHGYAEADDRRCGRSDAKPQGSNPCFGSVQFMTFEDVYTEGITKITAIMTDIEFYKEMGCTIKLLSGKDTRKESKARVHPIDRPAIIRLRLSMIHRYVF